jgi:GNAT superfamily N-acetyltransferase
MVGLGCAEQGGDGLPLPPWGEGGDYHTAVDEVLIRLPRPGDGDGLARCWVEFGAYYARLAPDLCQIPDADGLAAWIEAAWFSAPPAEACVLVAGAGGQAVGCVTARLRRLRATAPKQVVREPGVTCVLSDLLMVREAYRRRGIGRRLMVATGQVPAGRRARVGNPADGAAGRAA